MTTTVTCCYFWKMSWPSTNIGYVSLQQNASADNIIFYKTTDGGNTWVSNGIPSESVGLNPGLFYLQGLGFVSTNEGWVGGAANIGYLPSFLGSADHRRRRDLDNSTGFNDTYYINRFRFLSPNLGFASGGNLYEYNMPLVIQTQPQSQVVQAGNNLNLSVTASSLTPISYQWHRTQNGNEYSGHEFRIEPQRESRARRKAPTPSS